MPQPAPDTSRIERFGIAASPPRTSVPRLALWAVTSTVSGALFPRIAYRLRWLARARPATVALYIVAFAAFLFGVDAGMRLMGRAAHEQQELREELTQELGREPTDEEVRQAWMEAQGFPGNPAAGSGR